MSNEGANEEKDSNESRSSDAGEKRDLSDPIDPAAESTSEEATQSLDEDASSLREKRSVTRLTRQQISQLKSGPLPPGEDFKTYEEVTPGAGDRILTLAEKRSEHNQWRERFQEETASKIAKRGQLYAFLFGVLCLATAIVLSILGAIVPASIVGGVTLVSVSGLYIYGISRRNPNE